MFTIYKNNLKNPIMSSCLGPRLLAKMNTPLPHALKEEGEEMSEMTS